MVEQPEHFPQAVPEVYAPLGPLWALAASIAWALGPGWFLLSMWGGDAIPEWLHSPVIPLQYVCLLLTAGMGIKGGESRRTPEFWLLVVYATGFGIPLLGIKLGISFLVFVFPFTLIAAFVAAVAFPIMGVLRLTVHLHRRCLSHASSG